MLRDKVEWDRISALGPTGKKKKTGPTCTQRAVEDKGQLGAQ